MLTAKFIYIYGNAGATTTGSGTNTFIYYYDGSSTTGWNTAGTVGSSNMQGNPVNSLRAQGSPGSYLNRCTGFGPNTFTFFNVYTSSTLYFNAGTSTNPVTGTVLGTYTSTNSGTYTGLVGDGGGSTLYTQPGQARTENGI